jgi:hypothetical protein
MFLIRKLFWLALFLVATFGFVVLFEHGTDNYLQNAQAEFEILRDWAQPLERPKDNSDAVAR